MSINNYSLKGLSSSVQYGKNGGIFNWDSDNNYFSFKSNGSQYSKILLNNILLEEATHHPNSITSFATLYSLNDSNLYVKFSDNTVHCLTQPNLDFEDLVNNPWSISENEEECYSFLNVGINRSDVTSNYNLDVNGSILSKNIDIDNMLKIKNVYDTDPSYNSIYSQIYGKTDGKVYLKDTLGNIICLSDTNNDNSNLESNNPWSITDNENETYTFLNVAINKSNVTSNYQLDINGSILTTNIDIDSVLKIKNILDTDPNNNSNYSQIYGKKDGKVYLKNSLGTVICLSEPTIDIDNITNNPWSISDNENDTYTFLNIGINKSSITTNYQLDVNGSILTSNIDIDNMLKIKNVLESDPSINSDYSQIYGKTDGKVYLKDSQGSVFCLTEPTVDIDNVTNNPWSISGDENDVFTNLNLGIGNTNPQSTLHVTNNSTDANSSILRLETKSSSDSTTEFVEFYDTNTLQGKITGDSGNAVVYSTTSDKRLKENIQDTNINGSEIINKIKVRDFKWKKDQSEDIGLIAQELKEVYPKAVFGNEEKEFLTIEKQSLVPVLIKTLQEVIDKNNKLTLENINLNERLKRIEEKLL